MLATDLLGGMKDVSKTGSATSDLAATARIVPVILAGGIGTRLWPISRTAHPKQFLKITGDESLFQETLRRVSDPRLYCAPIVVTNNDYRFLAAEQSLETGIKLGAMLLEPVGRNTAPAIAAAAAYVAKTIHPRSVLHILPSDHAIDADAAYHGAVSLAFAAASDGRHVTFGITPTSPETGYGYIEAGEPCEHNTCNIRRFIEKPDLETAQKLVNSGGFLWNSGMFVLRTDVFLADCADLAPDVHRASVAAVEAASPDLDFIRLDPVSFGKAPDISVDYAIFERTSRAVVLPLEVAWSDLGSWDAVWKIRDKDCLGNLATGPVTLSNTSGSLIVSEKAHVAVEGLNDIAVIASEDAIYVGRLSEAQKVGGMVRLLRKSKDTADLTNVHRIVYRPWGGYASVLGGERFQVKRLFVKPGKKLSLQRHFHRSEHWVVVRGTAEVTIDNQVTTMWENQSIYLPQGCVHRLANPGRMLLELIEVQTGSYLGEDDIVRLDDDFGRC